MSNTRVERSESCETVCPVCHEQIDIFAIGPCDHPVCSRCSTRMRVLCQQMDCPICRSQKPQVAFVNKKSLFKDINLRGCIPNRKYKIFFEDKEVEDCFLDLLEYRCPLPSCQNRNADKSFALLQTHMRREHQLFACDLCVQHLKIFPYERKFYNRKNLAIHRRVGDDDDKSYKGHPLCEFCDVRYNDKDELLKHLRKDHFFCHYCDQHGSNAYYDQYPDLMKHFSDNHFLCTEGECGNATTRFTHAFVSEIDFKAHKASVHNKHLSKAQSREARTIDVDFQLPRRRPGHRADEYEELRLAPAGRSERYHRRRDYDANEAELQRAIEASKDLASKDNAVNFKESLPDPVADFPALNGAIAPVSVPATHKIVNTLVEDFPSLSAARSSKQPSQYPVKAYSTVMNRQVVDVKPVVTVQKETKPVSLGSVCKVYREAMSSAPRNTEDEYPTLGGTQNIAAKSSAGNWAKKSPNSNAVANSPINVNIKANTNLSKTSHNQSPIMKDENQFPKLLAREQEKNTDIKNVPDWMKQNSQQNVSAKQKEKAERSYDHSFELPEAYRQPFDELTPSEKSVRTVETVRSLPAAETEANKPAAINCPEEYPELPVRTGKTKTKDDNKKKKKIKKDETAEVKVSNETNKCLGEIALTLMQPGKDSSVGNDSRSSKPGKDSSVGNGSHGSKPGKHNSVSNGSHGSKPGKLIDWFDNPSSDLGNTKSASHVEELVAPITNDAPLEDSSHFPSLHSMSISIQQPKPPPGFSSSQQPSIQNQLSAPPGFEKQSSVSSISSTPSGLPLHVAYIQPADFKSRNLKLIEDIRQALVTVNEGFSNFKTLSSHFRQGLIDASSYYWSCSMLMGDEQFPQVFPELLSLLPDIQKQRELLSVYQTQVKQTHKVNFSQLSDCHVCGQVMIKEDVNYHQLQHASSIDFPLLIEVSNSKSAATPRVGSDVQVNGAWIRSK